MAITIITTKSYPIIPFFKRRREELAPGDKFVRVAFSEAEHDVDTAINQTVSELFNNNTTKHHGDLFKIVRFPTGMKRPSIAT